MRTLAGFGAGLVMCVSCSKSTDGFSPAATPASPKEAAGQIQRAFASSTPESKSIATAASEAIRSGDYEKAVVSLQTIKERKDLSFDQGVAIYNSEMSLEKTLLAGMSAGDAKAKQAYELLKKSRRN